MSSDTSMKGELSMKTSFLGLRLWVLIGLGVGVFIVLILCLLSIWIMFRRKTRRSVDKYSSSQIPHVSKDIKVDKVGVQPSHDQVESVSINVHDNMASDKNSDKLFVHLSKSSDPDNISQCSSVYHHERGLSSMSGEDGNFGTVKKQYMVTASPLIGLPEGSHLGWGHWFTLRDLELSTNRFAAGNVIGEGGYGVVYKGRLINGSEVAVKRLLNNLGQAEKEFRVEVDAIGHVRHKHLVRLLGFCIEGVHRLLVYEYVNNGNLEQWLHGAMRQHGVLTWEARMKVILGTAKALAYLHEAIEPKVVHRDIKSSNILIDSEFNAKVSDFGLAKLLDSSESHITTRVMGTFGYVAPEYANTGLLNEKSDIYSFGVLLLEAITGRDPVDYTRPANEVNLVEWMKMMVGAKRIEEVVDSSLEAKPPTRALKRSLLVAFRCVDPDSEKRPKMSQVVRMLEADEYPFREDRRNRRSRTASMEIESLKDISGPSDIDKTAKGSEESALENHMT
ncbi:receptor-like protein kinase [Trifolium pratense]|uniref:non-specific serine/threonine protein kinase n=3 Tax=Trifolium TaxID=3898 RepID=A0A2K3P4G5_TRIPR|nr:receptor-like protein kinase [Trifolium pratense]